MTMTRTNIHGSDYHDRPANILLSTDNVPVLVDFGFAERYELASKEAFHSNLSYGTPEYLSPERARGQPHDTRKSDVWPLGVTFFEILNGRTPFEDYDGEFLDTKEAVEQYWARTVRRTSMYRVERVLTTKHSFEANGRAHGKLHQEWRSYFGV